MFTHIVAISGFLQLLLVNLNFHLISFFFSLKNFFKTTYWCLSLLVTNSEFLVIWKCLEFPLPCEGYLSWVYSSCLLVSFLPSPLLPSTYLSLPSCLYFNFDILPIIVPLYLSYPFRLSNPFNFFFFFFSASCLWFV